MQNKEKYYITTAIAYTSRKPHIGNTYEIVLTDAIARFKRYMGYDVFSVPAPTSTAKKSRNWRTRPALRQRRTLTALQMKSKRSGI